MIFASFYTASGKYRALAQNLHASLKRFDLPSRIVEFPDAGDWRGTVGQKASFILALLCETRSPVVWLDADTVICRRPDLLIDTEADFATYNWLADASRTDRAYDPARLEGSGGVMRFGYTAPAMELLLRWDALQLESGGLDDPCLDYVFNERRPPVEPLWLPPAYNRMRGIVPDSVEPVIDHLYAGGAHRDGSRAY